MTRARRLARALTGARLAAALVIAIGVIILVGWATGVHELTTFLPSQPAAKADAALLLVLGGVALLLLSTEGSARRTIARCLALLIVALAGATLLEYVTGASLGVDALIPTSEVASGDAPYPGRIAAHGALGLLAAGLGLGLLGRTWRGWHPSQVLGIVCSLVGAFGFLAYLYRAPLVATVGFGTQVSLPAAGGLLILGVGIVSAGPDHSLMRLLRDPGMAGGAARRIMPAVLIVAPLAGALEVTLERAGLADAPVATIGMVAGVAGVIFGVAWWALIPGRAAETALRASEERFRVFFERTPDYAYLVSADRRLLDVNPAALAVLGYERDELVGRPLETIYAPESVGRLAELFETWKATGHLTNEEMTILSRSGERRVVLVSAGVAGNEAGGPQPSIAVQRDVTDLRSAEADLRLEERIRSALAESLHMIPLESTLAEVAQVICDELVRLPFIDMASIDAFIGSDEVQIVGHSAPSGHPVASGDFLPASRAALVRERAAAGPWAQYVEPDPADGGWLAKSVEAGLKAVAYGPIVHGDHMGGTVVIGTYDEHFARTFVERSLGLHLVQHHVQRPAGRTPPRVAPRVADLRRGSATVLASRCLPPGLPADRRPRVGRDPSATRPSPASTRASARTSASPTPGRWVSGPTSRSPRSRRRSAPRPGCPPGAGSTSTSRRACLPTPTA